VTKLAIMVIKIDVFLERNKREIGKVMNSKVFKNNRSIV
jgi:hypothetical protein